MNYQEIVEEVRNRENRFVKFDGGWPGHYGPAQSKYPNLAAELVARAWQIGTPVEAAGVSREVLAGAIEDGDLLDAEELRRIAERLWISYRYLCSPELSFVDPATRKGRDHTATLRELVEQGHQWELWGIHINNAETTLASLEHGESVTYAAWRWACQEIKREIEDRRVKTMRQHTIRRERRVAV